MKINPGDKLKPSPLSTLTTPKSPSVKSAAFADILEKNIKTEISRPVTTSPPIRPVTPPIMAAPNVIILDSTERMLNSMEQYQKLLSDPKVSLKDVGAALRQLSTHMFNLEPLVDQMPEKDALKQIAQEALTTAAKEVARFDGGSYVQ